MKASTLSCCAASNSSVGGACRRPSSPSWCARLTARGVDSGVETLAELVHLPAAHRVGAAAVYIFPIPAVCRRSTLSKKSWRRRAREEHHDAPAGDSVVGSATPSEWSRSAVPSVLNPTWPLAERLLRRARARLSAPRLPADAPSALVAHHDRDVLPLGPAWPGYSPNGLTLAEFGPPVVSAH